jgi:ribosomal protein S18 acetylase RimI-like enzyme
MADMAGRLPAPYTGRPAGLEDAAAVAALMNANAMALVGEPYTTAEDLWSEWQAPGHDLPASSLLVHGPGGSLAALALVEALSPFIEAFAILEIDTAHRGRGLGPALVDWVEGRAPELVATAPADAQTVIRWGVWVGEADLQELLTSYGYGAVRHFWRMTIELDRPPPQPQWPAGIAVRTFTRGEDEPAVHAAVDEAFRDHWGDDDEPFDVWLYDRIEGPAARFDPDLWFLAMDGDEVAGVAICEPRARFDPASGYVRDLGVRPAWRRRGIARALLLHAFGAFHARGTAIASLHVDSANPTGALPLYLDAGMTALPRFEIWEKPVERAPAPRGAA